MIKNESKSIAANNFEKLRLFANEQIEDTIENIKSTWDKNSVAIKTVDQRWQKEFSSQSLFVNSYESFKSSIIAGSNFLSDQETEKLLKKLFNINNPDLNKIRKNFMSENDGPDEFISSKKMLTEAFESLFNSEYKSADYLSKDIIKIFSFCFHTIKDAKNANSYFIKILSSSGIDFEKINVNFDFDTTKDYDKLYSLEEDLNELLFNLIPMEIQNKFTIQINLFFSRVNKNITLLKMDKEESNFFNFTIRPHDLTKNPLIGTVVFDMKTSKNLAKLTSDQFDIVFKEMVQKAILDGYKDLYCNVDKKILSEVYDLEPYWMFAKEETIKTILVERFKLQNPGFYKDELQIMMSYL